MDVCLIYIFIALSKSILVQQIKITKIKLNVKISFKNKTLSKIKFKYSK